MNSSELIAMSSEWSKMTGTLSVRKVGEDVRLCRMRGGGSQPRYMTCPKKTFQLALDNLALLDSGEKLVGSEEVGWKLSQRDWMGRSYIAFEFLDEHYARVG